MPRKANPKIVGFGERVEWIIKYLDPNPLYARFISKPADVLMAMNKAVGSGHFQLLSNYGERRRSHPGFTEEWWRTALRTGNVSPDFIGWLYALYDDLKSPQMEAATLEQFLSLGLPIKAARDFWGPSVRYFAENRKKLHASAMAFYDQVQDHGLDKSFPVPFPLLIQLGWIRAEPMALEEHTEAATLESPGPFRSFDQPGSLQGLSGDYINYRGTLGASHRRAVRLEPQHNGEIFCARDIVTDDNGFIGFRYDLGRYFDYINTSEVLGTELAKWALDHNSDAKLLPARFDLRGQPSDAFDLGNRATYPGVNCLSVFLNYSEPEKLKEPGKLKEPEKLKSGNYFLLHKRDETQLQAQNSIHVVPAGGHQGFAKGAQREDTAIWRTVVREFAEELFNKEKLSNQSETWSDFALHRDVKTILETFFSGQNPAAKIYLHGFGLDPVTLKPEILCTIVIDWSKLTTPKPALKFNWELQTNDPKVTRHQWVPLSKDALVREATEQRQLIGDRRLDALPAGAACMLLTALHYERLGLPEAAI